VRASLAPMRVELSCPACLEDLAGITFDARYRAACRACGAQLAYAASGGPLFTMPAFVKPSDRHLARRVEAPPRTRLRFRRTDDRLQAQSSSWLVRLFEKKVVLAPDGFSTWARRGFAVPLAEVVGFFALPYLVNNSLAGYVSAAVFQTGGEEKFNQIFLHTKDDAEYFASTFNSHLAELRSRHDPYRG